MNMSWIRNQAVKLNIQSRLLLASMLLMSASLSTQAALLERFTEGTHYQLLKKPVTTQDPNKIEVVEVFSYLCMHCYSLEPLLTKWEKTLPDDVVFVRKHAQFNKEYMAYAKFHVTLQILGIESKMRESIFESIHEKRTAAYKPEDQYELLKESGVKKETFLNTFNSFTHETKLKQVEKDLLAYQITGVPAIIVNGKYRLSESSAGSRQSMLELIEFLIDKERSQLPKVEKAAK
jgi:thiol:disulfide interchange protein DsbA